jgi:tetratricopeptide (TPR) repeat protein
VRKELQASRHEPSAAAAARREVRVRNLERFGIEPEDEIGVPLAAAHAILGRMLELLDRQAAIEHFRAALQLWPGSATHAALGGILAKTNPGEASQHLQTALSLNPNNASAYANLGYIHARAGRYDAAIVCYRNALALEPDLPAVRDGLAAVLKIVRGDRQGAGAAETGNNPP